MGGACTGCAAPAADEGRFPPNRCFSLSNTRNLLHRYCVMHRLCTESSGRLCSPVPTESWPTRQFVQIAPKIGRLPGARPRNRQPTQRVSSFGGVTAKNLVFTRSRTLEMQLQASIVAHCARASIYSPWCFLHPGINIPRHIPDYALCGRRATIACRRAKWPPKMGAFRRFRRKGSQRWAHCLSWRIHWIGAAVVPATWDSPLRLRDLFGA